MIYQNAIAREAYQLKNAEKLHPDYDADQIKDFIRERYEMIVYFQEKIRERDEAGVKFH